MTQVGGRALALALVVGFAAGLAAALYVAWVVWPVEFVNSSTPAQLEPAAREGYLILVAETFDQDGDLKQARRRLEQMAQPGEGATDGLVALTEQYLRHGQDVRTLRKLARLAHALGVSRSEMLVYLPADRPTPTRTPTPEAVVAPKATATPTPTATPAVTYQLVEKGRVCSPDEGPGQIQVVVRDAEGMELPGARVGLAWPEGGEAIFTGFQPDRGEGYADAVMDHPGDYRVTVLQDGGGEVVGNLAADPTAAGCPAEARSVIWRVVFQQSRPAVSSGG